MHEALQELAVRAVAAENSEAPDFGSDGPRISVAEYCALYAVQIARNFDGIAFAQSTKPARELGAHC